MNFLALIPVRLWIIGGAGVLLALVVGTFYVQNGHLKNVVAEQEIELKQVRSKLDESESERRLMLVQVQRQNEAVELLHDRAARNHEKVEHLLGIWEQNNRARQSHIAFLTGRIEASTDKSCMAAVKEIREMLR